MKLAEAKKKIDELANIPFKNYLSPAQYNDIIKNKGKTGQILELTIGLQLSNTTLDFEDGELKTNKCDKYGKPKETMFITQASSMIDEILEIKPFETTKLYKKLQNILSHITLFIQKNMDVKYLIKTELFTSKKSL